MLPRLIVTAGEPAGIGPDLCLAAADRSWSCALVVVGDAEGLAARAELLRSGVTIVPFRRGDAHRPHEPGVLRCLHVPFAAPARPGILDPRNARFVLASLDAAIEGCMTGEFDAIVTAPVQKSVINEAGVPFSGHTEYLAQRTGGATPVMMLVAGSLRVALATTHVPLRDVAESLTAQHIRQVVQILAADLHRRFGIAKPRIIVCGLNPHAGEAGHLGREEIDVIAPTVLRLRKEGLNLIGPSPADTAFTPHMLKDADAVLAMYHDQGLPVIKYAGFGHAVNVTLGLPILRTSVDHGTALSLAGTGTADAGSLIAAIEMAIDLANASTPA